MIVNRTIAINIDRVLAASDDAWLLFLENVTGVKLSNPPKDYNLANYFQHELVKEGLDGFEFWKMADPYAKVLPVEGAIEACSLLATEGYRLLPVSKIYTEHTTSKRKWLKRYFPMLDEPIYISMGGRKSDIKCDYIIDDRRENFAGFKHPVQGVLFDNGYRQNTHCNIDIDYDVVQNWQQVVHLFTKVI